MKNPRSFKRRLARNVLHAARLLPALAAIALSLPAVHAAPLDLTPLSDVTHTATSSGSWSDPAIWQSGQVPGDDARVHIPNATSVTYDVSESNAKRLDWTRVDGTLRLAGYKDTYLLVDTLIVSGSGALKAGSSSNPIGSNIRARVVFSHGGGITQLSGAPMSDLSASDRDKVFDGNLYTEANVGGSTTSWFGLDLGSPQKVTVAKVNFHKPTNFRVELADNANFNNPVVVAERTFSGGRAATVGLDDAGAYRYARMVITDNFRRIKEVSFWTGDNTQLDPAEDPEFSGRGMMTMGDVQLFGAGKTDWLALDTPPQAGDTKLVFAEQPQGWQTGDRIILTGTDVNEGAPDDLNARFQDELLEVTGVSQNNGKWEVTFINRNQGAGGVNDLLYDHLPTPGYGLKVYCGNLTRNVTFETEQWEAGAVPTQQRAHIMFMKGGVVTENVGFYGLGRSDKRIPITDPGTTDPDEIDSYNNVRGRYPVHFHKIGTETSLPASTVKGCVVWGSPGWGFTVHKSRVNVLDSVAYDCIGVAFMTEEGQEIGSFQRCLAVKGRGSTYEQSHPFESGFARFDFGIEGDGFWIQGGGGFTVTGNVAASMAGSGFAYWGNEDDRSNDLFHMLTENLDYPRLANANLYGEDPAVELVPLRTFSDNTAFNAERGMTLSYYLRAGKELGTVRTFQPNVIERFTTWGNHGLSTSDHNGNGFGGSGLFVEYSSQTIVRDCLILGNTTSLADPTSTLDSKSVGIHGNWEGADLWIENTVIEGFDQGVSTFSTHRFSMEWMRGMTVIDGGRFNNRINLTPAPTILGDIGERGALNPPFGYIEVINDPVFQDLDNDNAAPSAAFTSSALGGLSVQFDAAGASDSDHGMTAAPGIASYVWDFDNDGAPDAFGPVVAHTFAAGGSKTVTLTVYDNTGTADAVTQSVSVSTEPYVNAIPDPGFDAVDMWGSYNNWSTFQANAGRYWATSQGNPWGEISGGTLSFIGNGRVGATFPNDRAHRGPQTFTVDLRNTGQDGTPNELNLRIFGLNVDNNRWFGKAQGFSVWSLNGPAPVGDFPITSTLLYDGASTNLLAGPSPWEQVVIDNIDFGSEGYDYIIFLFESAGLGGADELEMDNLFLGGDSGPNPNPEPSSSVAEVDATARLGHVKFDNDAGDEDGNLSLNFVSGASVAAGAGQFGSAVRLDGGGEGVAIDAHPDFNNGNGPWAERTISLWFSVDNPSNPVRQMIFDEGGSTRGINAYLDNGALYVGGWDTNGSDPGDNASWSGTFKSTNAVTAGVWNHLTIVLDASADPANLNSGVFRAYLNGVEFDAGNSDGMQIYNHGNAGGLGALFSSSKFHSGTSASSLSGYVDDFAVWNRALDAAEIATVAGAAPSGTQFAENNGLVVMEAENATASFSGVGGLADKSWQPVNASAASGGVAMEAQPNDGGNAGDSTDGPRLDFAVDFATTGTWYLWARMNGPGGTNDSLHAGIGSPATYGDKGLGASTNGAYQWVNTAAGSAVTVNVASAGEHTVSVWMREDGVIVDKLLLTTNSSYAPSGTGPGETLGSGSTGDWTEDFSDGLADGDASDTGDTAWSIDTSSANGAGSSGFIFAVQSGEFFAQKTQGEAIWISETIDVSGASSASISLDVRSERILEAADTLEAAYRLDGGGEVTIATGSDNFADAGTTWTASGIDVSAASTIEVLVKANVSYTDEAFAWDNVTVSMD